MTYKDPTEVSSAQYTILLQEGNRRMVEMRVKPGETDTEHSHPDELVYFVKGGKARVHLPGGETMDVEFPDGGTMAHEAWTHQVENIGDTEIHAIIFEVMP